jgi:hypothetical protein
MVVNCFHFYIEEDAVQDQQHNPCFNLGDHEEFKVLIVNKEMYSLLSERYEMSEFNVTNFHGVRVIHLDIEAALDLHLLLQESVEEGDRPKPLCALAGSLSRNLFPETAESAA